MTQQTGDDLQSTKLGEYLLRELKMIHNALRHDLAICRALADQIAAGAASQHVREQIESLRTSSRSGNSGSIVCITVALCMPTIMPRTWISSRLCAVPIPGLAPWWTS